MAERLEFYDLITKTKFFTDKYTTSVSKKGMLIAKATTPSGVITVKMIKKA